MPNNVHIDMVARRLRQELGTQAFLTVERTHLTAMLRRVSGEPTTRIKRRLAEELTEALRDQGVECYPSLAETTTGDVVRLYHAGSIVGQLVDLLTAPDPLGGLGTGSYGPEGQGEVEVRPTRERWAAW